MSLAEITIPPRPRVRRQQFDGVVELATRKDEDALWNHMYGVKEGLNGTVLTDEELTIIIDKGCRQDGGVFGVVKEDGRVVASTLMRLNKLWYSNEHFLLGLWHYVEPAHRKSPCAKNLIQFAKWYADKLDMPLVFDVGGTPELSRKRDMFGREMSPAGACFMYRGEFTEDPPPAGVAVAGPECMEALFDLYKWLGDDNALTPPDYERFRHTLTTPDKGDSLVGSVIGVIGTPDRLEAACVLKLEGHDLTPEGFALVEKFVANRGDPRNYAKLTNFAKWTARRVGAPLSIGILTRKRADAKVRLYRREFGEPTLFTYLYER